MKKIIILVLLLFSFSKVFCQKKEKLPDFKTFEIAFYNFLENGYVYDFTQDCCDHMGLIWISFDYKSLIMDYIYNFNFSTLSLKKSNYNELYYCFQAFPKNNYKLDIDTAFNLRYKYNKDGRISYFTTDGFYKHCQKYFCEYSNDTAFVKSKSGILECKAIYKNDRIISKTNYTYTQDIIHSKDSVYIQTTPENSYNFTYHYNENGYPSYIITKGWRTDTVHFDYVLGDTFQIIRNRKDCQDIFKYDYNGKLLNYKFILQDSIRGSISKVETNINFYYNKNDFDSVTIIESYKYPCIKDSLPVDYLNKKVVFNYKYINNKISSIINTVTVNKLYNKKYCTPPTDILFISNDKSYTGEIKFNYTKDKLLESITNDREWSTSEVKYIFK